MIIITWEGSRRPPPPFLVWFSWLWLLKALKRLLKGFIIKPTDRGILRNITSEKLPADKFDEHLVEKLDYRTPQLLADELQKIKAVKVKLRART